MGRLERSFWKFIILGCCVKVSTMVSKTIGLSSSLSAPASSLSKSARVKNDMPLADEKPLPSLLFHKGMMIMGKRGRAWRRYKNYTKAKRKRDIDL